MPREEPSAAQRDRYEAATSADRPAGHQVEESVTARVLSYARHYRGVFNVRPAVNPMAESALPQCLARHRRSPRTKPPSVHPCSPSGRTYCLLRVVMRANPRPAVASGRACAGRGGLPYRARFVVAAWVPTVAISAHQFGVVSAARNGRQPATKLAKGCPDKAFPPARPLSEGYRLYRRIFGILCRPPDHRPNSRSDHAYAVHRSRTRFSL